MHRVVITGAGAISPLGTTADELWRGMLDGRSGVQRLARLAFGSSKVTTGGEVTSIAADCLDRDIAIASSAIDEALAEAALDASEAGFIWSTGLDTLKTDGTSVCRRPAGVSFRSLACRFARPRRMIAVACASGSQAIGEAYSLIRRGRLDACMAGGSSTMLTPYYAKGFDALGAVAVDRDDEAPESACKPFDQRRRGFVLADGAGALLLERRDRALCRGATPLAEVIGFGSSQDAYDLNRPPDDGAGAALCIRRALVSAGCEANDIDAVNAHGTGTLAGDAAEARAIREVLGGSVAVHSAKGALGHTMAAAGALEAIVALRTCATGIVPATRNLEIPDPGCAVDHVMAAPRDIGARRVLSNSFGMGGQNAALILERAHE